MNEQRGIYRHSPGSYRQVLALAYPVIITMISQTVMGLVDNIMVGRLGTTQFAAVGFSGSIIWTSFAFFNGLMSSANTFISQDYGSGKYGVIGKTVWHYLYLSVLSYLFLLGIIPISNLILRLVGPSANFRLYGGIYARIRLYSGIWVFISFALANFFRGIGNTKTPMYIAMASNVFNMVANYALIFGKFGMPRLEVKGAALATLLSSLLSATLYFVLAMSRKYDSKYSIRRIWRIEYNLAKRVLRIGLPMGVQFFLDSASFTLFAVFVAKMGEVPFAASNAAMSLMSTSFMPLIGISIATTTLVGQFIGAKQLAHARKTGYTAIKIGVSYTVMTALSFFIFGKQLISIMISDPAVISLGAKILIMAGIFQLSDGFGICSNGALRGAGDTRFVMIVGLSYAWLLFIPLSYIFGFVLNWGVIGAWFGASIYIILYGITVFIRFRRGKWESIKI